MLSITIFVAWPPAASTHRWLKIAFEQGELPPRSGFVVTQNVSAAVIAAHFEVAVVRRKPTIQLLNDLDAALTHIEAPRSLLTSVTRVTLDSNLHGLTNNNSLSAHTVSTAMRVTSIAIDFEGGAQCFLNFPMERISVSELVELR